MRSQPGPRHCVLSCRKMISPLARVGPYGAETWASEAHKTKRWKAICGCAESLQLSPSPSLALQFSRSDRLSSDHGSKPLTQVARSNLDGEADQSPSVCFHLGSTA